MELVRQILGVSVVLSLLLALLWWTRRGTGLRIAGWPRPAAARKSIEAVERVSLTPQHSLHLVRFRGQQLLIGVYTSGIVLLDRSSAAPVEGRGSPVGLESREAGT